MNVIRTLTITSVIRPDRKFCINEDVRRHTFYFWKLVSVGGFHSAEFVFNLESANRNTRAFAEPYGKSADADGLGSDKYKVYNMYANAFCKVDEMCLFSCLQLLEGLELIP